jgi:pimeloyl-ACP methyl ester carboxylesterase
MRTAASKPRMERNVHHEVRGTGEPLLLVHGTGSSLRVWDPLVERLAARRTVIAVDLPGFGASPPLTPSGPPPGQRGLERERFIGANLATNPAAHRGNEPGSTKSPFRKVRTCVAREVSTT